MKLKSLNIVLVLVVLLAAQPVLKSEGMFWVTMISFRKHTTGSGRTQNIFGFNP